MCKASRAWQGAGPAEAAAPQGPWNPRMRLVCIYVGPRPGVVVQHWRDPTTGTECFLRLPAARPPQVNCKRPLPPG
jgi:hypothetical protein